MAKLRFPGKALKLDGRKTARYSSKCMDEELISKVKKIKYGVSLFTNLFGDSDDDSYFEGFNHKPSDNCKQLGKKDVESLKKVNNGPLSTHSALSTESIISNNVIGILDEVKTDSIESDSNLAVNSLDFNVNKNSTQICRTSVRSSRIIKPNPKFADGAYTYSKLSHSNNNLGKNYTENVKKLKFQNKNVEEESDPVYKSISFYTDSITAENKNQIVKKKNEKEETNCEDSVNFKEEKVKEKIEKILKSPWNNRVKNNLNKESTEKELVLKKSEPIIKKPRLNLNEMTLNKLREPSSASRLFSKTDNHNCNLCLQSKTSNVNMPLSSQCCQNCANSVVKLSESSSSTLVCVDGNGECKLAGLSIEKRCPACCLRYVLLNYNFSNVTHDKLRKYLPLNMKEKVPTSLSKIVSNANSDHSRSINLSKFVNLLPEGWKRKNGHSVTVFSPDGVEFKSVTDLTEYLVKKGIDADAGKLFGILKTKIEKIPKTVIEEKSKDCELNKSQKTVATELPGGWTRKIHWRRSGKILTYVYSPSGLRFRSRKELSAYFIQIGKVDDICKYFPVQSSKNFKHNSNDLSSDSNSSVTVNDDVVINNQEVTTDPHLSNFVLSDLSKKHSLTSIDNIENEDSNYLEEFSATDSNTKTVLDDSFDGFSDTEESKKLNVKITNSSEVKGNGCHDEQLKDFTAKNEAQKNGDSVKTHESASGEMKVEKIILKIKKDSSVEKITKHKKKKKKKKRHRNEKDNSKEDVTVLDIDQPIYSSNTELESTEVDSKTELETTEGDSKNELETTEGDSKNELETTEGESKNELETTEGEPKNELETTAVDSKNEFEVESKTELETTDLEKESKNDEELYNLKSSNLKKRASLKSSIITVQQLKNGWSRKIKWNANGEGKVVVLKNVSGLRFKSSIELLGYFKREDNTTKHVDLDYYFPKLIKKDDVMSVKENDSVREISVIKDSKSISQILKPDKPAQSKLDTGNLRKFIEQKKRERLSKLIEGQSDLESSDGGPRTKQVCRSQAQVLGLKRAVFPKKKKVLYSNNLGVLSNFRNKQRLRTTWCKKCEGCLTPECMECIYCLDRRKYGGKDKLRKKCIYRKCYNPQHPLKSVVQLEPKKSLIKISDAATTKESTPVNERANVQSKAVNKEIFVPKANSKLQFNFKEKVEAQKEFIPGTKMNIDYWGAQDADEFGVGFPIVSTHPIAVDSFCFRCGSAGTEDLLFCIWCCEGVHPFCLDEDECPDNEDSESLWVCRNCAVCHVCGVSSQYTCSELLQCSGCRRHYHLECLGADAHRLCQPSIQQYRQGDEDERVWKMSQPSFLGPEQTPLVIADDLFDFNCDNIEILQEILPLRSKFKVWEKCSLPSTDEKSKSPIPKLKIGKNKHSAREAFYIRQRQKKEMASQVVKFMREWDLYGEEDEEQDILLDDLSADIEEYIILNYKKITWPYETKTLSLLEYLHDVLVELCDILDYSYIADLMTQGLFSVDYYKKYQFVYPDEDEIKNLSISKQLKHFDHLNSMISGRRQNVTNKVRKKRKLEKVCKLEKVRKTRKPEGKKRGKYRTKKQKLKEESENQEKLSEIIENWEKRKLVDKNETVEESQLLSSEIEGQEKEWNEVNEKSELVEMENSSSKQNIEASAENKRSIDSPISLLAKKLKLSQSYVKLSAVDKDFCKTDNTTKLETENVDAFSAELSSKNYEETSFKSQSSKDAKKECLVNSIVVCDLKENLFLSDQDIDKTPTLLSPGIENKEKISPEEVNDSPKKKIKSPNKKVKFDSPDSENKTKNSPKKINDSSKRKVNNINKKRKRDSPDKVMRRESLKSKQDITSPAKKLRKVGSPNNKVKFDSLDSENKTKNSPKKINDSLKRKGNNLNKKRKRDSPEKVMRRESPKSKQDITSPAKKLRKVGSPKKVKFDSPEKIMKGNSQNEKSKINSPKKKVKFDSPEKIMIGNSQNEKIKINSSKNKVKFDSPEKIMKGNSQKKKFKINSLTEQCEEINSPKKKFKADSPNKKINNKNEKLQVHTSLNKKSKKSSLKKIVEKRQIEVKFKEIIQNDESTNKSGVEDSNIETSEQVEVENLNNCETDSDKAKVPVIETSTDQDFNGFKKIAEKKQIEVKFKEIIQNNESINKSGVEDSNIETSEQVEVENLNNCETDSDKAKVPVIETSTDQDFNGFKKIAEKKQIEVKFKEIIQNNESINKSGVEDSNIETSEQVEVENLNNCETDSDKAKVPVIETSTDQDFNGFKKIAEKKQIEVKFKEIIQNNESINKSGVEDSNIETSEQVKVENLNNCETDSDKAKVPVIETSTDQDFNGFKKIVEKRRIEVKFKEIIQKNESTNKSGVEDSTIESSEQIEVENSNNCETGSDKAKVPVIETSTDQDFSGF